MKILIVDDNVDSVKSAETFLGLCGFEVEAAFSGTGAENVLSQTKFDAVILDYRIEDLSGLDVLRWMRVRDLVTPVVMTTGVDADVVDYIKKMVEAENLGPVVVLGKPYDSEVLVGTLESFDCASIVNRKS